MARYKYADETSLVVNDLDKGLYGITQSSRFWGDYQAWLAEGNVTEPYMDKQDAYEQMLSEVNSKNSQENLKDFSYVKDSVSRDYRSDQDSIQGTQNSINGGINIGTMLLTDPCPSPNGMWKTAEVEADGITPVYVAYTNEEFLHFAEAYFGRASANFGVKELHKANLRNLLENPNATVQDILEYDYSQGWY